jgi:predicted SnoaL-like aldol condensation-catalyzing enzyme
VDEARAHCYLVSATAIISGAAMTRLFATAAALLTLGTSALAESPAQIEANKQAVLGFYQAALNDKDFDAPHYKQHNPTLPDGAEGIRKLTEILRARAPNMHVDIKHIFAVDDFVIIHSHSVSDPAKPGRAIADFYRMTDGLIAEHWDVIQDIPEHSANDNGMF